MLSLKMSLVGSRSVVAAAASGDKDNPTKQNYNNSISPSKNINAQEQELPPLVYALKNAASQRMAASFHFPGHNRGRAAPSSMVRLIGDKPFLHDLPELPELDNLFSPEGAILDAQKQAALLFGSSETWFLVGGTTCGIQAAIMATCCPGDILILPRNSHVSAFSGMVLSGAVPKYIVPEYNTDWDIAGGVTPLQVEKAIEELQSEGRKPAAVFVTSPTYHGICSELSEISKLCHLHGVPVIVDEAHGAHLGFHLQLHHSALQQGADIAVQSTHKVLCSLTQSSMLHLYGNIVDRNRICRCLQTLQSTSPSYLLLASLDAARAQLQENPKSIFDKVVKLAIVAKHLIQNIPGISVLNSTSFANFPTTDPLRLTIGFWQLGLSGYEADEILFKDQEIISELVETQSVTFAINLGTSEEHIQRLVEGIKCLPVSSLSTKRTEESTNTHGCRPFIDFNMRLNPRDAFFANKLSVNINDSLGMICGELICPYPPGIPVMVPGEIITDAALQYLMELKSKGAEVSGASDPQLLTISICNL